MPPQDRQKMEEMGMHFAVYSFKGTFDDVKARASNELVSEGYMDFGAFGVPPQKGKARQAAYMKGNMFAGMSGTTGSTPQIPDMQMVMIMEDTQITPQTPFSAGPDPSGKAKGWVSVVIMGKLEKTFFDRCKDWIGL